MGTMYVYMYVCNVCICLYWCFKFKFLSVCTVYVCMHVCTYLHLYTAELIMLSYVCGMRCSICPVVCVSAVDGNVCMYACMYVPVDCVVRWYPIGSLIDEERNGSPCRLRCHLLLPMRAQAEPQCSGLIYCMYRC